MADNRAPERPTNVAPDTTSAAPAANTNLEQLLAATLAQLAEANRQNAESNKQIVALMEEQQKHNKAALRIAPRRKKSMQEYLSQRAKAGKHKHLPHPVYQNGREVNPSGLAQETIDTLDKIDSGHYCDGLVDVIRLRDGVDGINSKIFIHYNNKTLEQRMAFYIKFPTFTSLVNQIAADMVAQGKPFVEEKGTEAPAFEFPDEMSELI
jgi:hypothetical protein